MESLAEPTLVAFIVQALILVLPIPYSYFAYRWSQAPKKRDQTMEDMAYLGLQYAKDWDKKLKEDHDLRPYLAPLLFASITLLVTFALTHPLITNTGLKAGILEEIVEVFGPETPFPTVVLVGRFLFWAWLGAYIYAVILILRRFMDYDLTPNVYIFACNRFLLAFVISSIVGVGLGTYTTATNIGLSLNLATVYIVAFFIGFFPEQGIIWLTMMAQRALKQQGGVAKEVSLAEIDGLSIWHQSRLKQINIENVQNLATADVPNLVVSTPFSLNEIIDWVDQAILLLYTSEAQLAALQRVGIHCASDLLVLARKEQFDELAEASGLKPSELSVLGTVLESALNIKVVAYYRWQSSMDIKIAQESARIQPYQAGV
jgi:hypothetical protein